MALKSINDYIMFVFNLLHLCAEQCTLVGVNCARSVAIRIDVAQSGARRNKMKKYILAGLLAMTLVGGASAQVVSTTAARPIVRNVPDSGPTVALLGLSVILIVLAQRKLAKS